MFQVATPDADGRIVHSVQAYHTLITIAEAYGVQGILASQILEGKAGTPTQAARDFTGALERATGQAQSASGTTAAPATTPTPSEAEGAQTFPMEDPAPGAPPPQ
jgi:hypothetical protein